ncbi:hypothetical protein WJ438_38280 [Streptomyces sp. GD-15H]
MCRQSSTIGLVKSPTHQHRATGPLAERPLTRPIRGADAGSVTRSRQYC